MIKYPKISIITACYNSEKTIEQTIKSVINQTYENIEYIIVDGASTDGTMEIVEKYKDQIDIIISEPDEGIYDAFNKGALHATGDFVQYLGSDDYLIDDTAIFDIKNIIQERPDVVIVYGGIIFKNDSTGYMSILNKEIDYSEFKRGTMIPHPATFTKREIMLKVGLFDSSYRIAADYDLTAKIFKKYADRIFHFQRLVSVFRLGGISSQLLNKNLINKEMNKSLLNNFGINDYKMREISNEEHLKVWLEKKNFEHKNITDFLKEIGVKKVVIWGTGIVSNLLVPECEANNIQVEAFVDNDVQKQGYRMNNILIQSSNWLLEYGVFIDAIIFGFEGRHEEAVRKQLGYMNINIDSYSWRELLEN